MRIEGLHVKNFRTFQDVRFSPLPSLAVFVGANGTGKSSLFDIFKFLQDALTHNVRTALQLRGGFEELRSRGQEGPISIEIDFREQGELPISYFLQMGLERGEPLVEKELLKYQGSDQAEAWHLLDFSRGQGIVIKNAEDLGKADCEVKREEKALDTPDILAIKGLGQFQQFPLVSAVRKMIERWNIADFHRKEIRTIQASGYAEHLITDGANLSLVAQYIEERFPQTFEQVVEKLKSRVPGLETVSAVRGHDGRMSLQFKDEAFPDAFASRYVSDGTLKLLAYLFLIDDPQPSPLLCLESPESHIFPPLLAELSNEFRSYTHSEGQIIITTHSPEILNTIELEEVFCLSKKDGFTQLKRASDDKFLKAMNVEGHRQGAFWKQHLFNSMTF